MDKDEYIEHLENFIEEWIQGRETEIVKRPEIKSLSDEEAMILLNKQLTTPVRLQVFHNHVQLELMLEWENYFYYKTDELLEFKTMIKLYKKCEYLKNKKGKNNE